MFNKHLIVKNKGEQILYLFIDYNYEFGEDLLTPDTQKRNYSLYERVIRYIKEHRISFKGAKVFLVINGIIIGSLILGSQPYNSSLKDEVTPKYQYVEILKDFGKPELTEEKEAATKSNTNNQVVSTAPTSVTPPKITTPTTGTKTPTKTTSSNVHSTTKPSTSTVTNTTSPAVTPTPPKTEPTSVPTPTPTPQPIPEPAVTGPIVTVHRYNGTIQQINLEDYVIGVVAGEMPASFNNEALKAQALTARTYALKSISQNRALTDTVSTQVYKDISQLKSIWGNSFDTYYNKIKNVVTSTKGQYLTYNGKYIDALFFSTSNGRTEDAAAVWGNSYPYLVSVDSHWDLSVPGFQQDKAEPITTLDSIIGLNITDQSTFQVLSRTPGNRINTINVDGKTFTGKQLRELLGLRSTDFDVRVEGGNAIFTTRGYGHGVGMSQYGANGMAKEGYTYRQILSHYYPGTNISNI